MPASNANAAAPQLRAYAQVNEDGTSPNLNSGVTTSRLATGIYDIDLPANQAVIDGHELVFIQIKLTATDDLMGSNYQVLLSGTRVRVTIWQGAVVQRINNPFNIFIYATTIPSELD